MTYQRGQHVRCVDPRETRFDEIGYVTEAGLLVYVTYPQRRLPDGGPLPVEVAHRADQVEPVSL